MRKRQYRVTLQCGCLRDFCMTSFYYPRVNYHKNLGLKVKRSSKNLHDSHFFPTLDEFCLFFVHSKTAPQRKTKNLPFATRGQNLTNNNCVFTTFSAILFFSPTFLDHLLLEKTKKSQIFNFKTYIILKEKGQQSCGIRKSIQAKRVQ